MEVQQEEKWIKHYSSKHDILLVGEGDFSFGACLATAFGNAHNMVATSLDSQEMLETKYPTTAFANLDVLRSKGCTVVHGVDASTMAHHSSLWLRKFDRIVFNFPHAGFPASEGSSYQIELHQEVVRGFMGSAYEMVRARGEVHITHKTEAPYSRWNIEEIGEEKGFVLIEKAAFDIYDYPAYQNKRGSGSNSNATFRLGNCATFKFVLK